MQTVSHFVTCLWHVRQFDTFDEHYRSLKRHLIIGSVEEFELRSWSCPVVLKLDRHPSCTVVKVRGHFAYAPSQWETTLQCNVITNWLGAYTQNNPCKMPLISKWYGNLEPYLLAVSHCMHLSMRYQLTHQGWDKMAAIYQTTFSNAFSWMKRYKFLLKFHFGLFPRVQLTIFQHWFR